MNPVFYLIVIMIAVTLWFLLAFIFYPLGRFLYRIYTDTVHELEREDDKNKKGKDETI